MTVSQERVFEAIRSFLKTRYAYVGTFAINDLSTNVRNPFPDTWDDWGTRMIRVFGDGQVSEGRWGPYRSVPFELAIYARKSGGEVSYSGRVYESGYPPATLQDGSERADVVSA